MFDNFNNTDLNGADFNNPDEVGGTFEAFTPNRKPSDSDNPPPPPTKKKSKSGIVFLIIVVITAIVAVAFCVFAGLTLAKQPKTPTPPTQNIMDFGKAATAKKIVTRNSPYVARLHISGIIQEENQTYNQEWLLSTIEDLKKDAQNVGIILVIDSPGGTVYEADGAYLALCDYRDSGKKVWAYFKSLAASGGYYIACAADTIYANRNTLTGSIGVISGTSVDATEFLDKIGIKTNTFTAGKNKNMLNFNSPLTEEQQNIMQSIADETYEQFASIVAEARKMHIDEVRVLADGRIYTASQAKANGLIDEIAALENAEKEMAATIAAESGGKYDNADAISFHDYEYEYRPRFLNKFFSFFNGATLLDPVTRAAIDTIAPDIKYPAYLYRQ